MEYTVEEVDRFGDVLLALPEMDPAQRKLDKQGAVKRLKEKIALIQQRGYTIEQIAESLTTAGLQLTTPTLKSYLQRAKKTGGKGAAKAPRRAASPTVRTVDTGRAENASLSVSASAKAAAAEGVPKSTHSEFNASDRVRVSRKEE
jgi:hypothetical protein